MKLFERILLARIDRALDDGKPLTGLTSRLVLRNERLRRYYESMLALELELRFSDDASSDIPVVASRSVSRRSRRPFAVGIAAVACLLVAIGLFFQGTPESPPMVYPPPGDAFPGSSVALVPWEGIDEALVDFSERPLELTSMLVSQIGSVIAKRSPAE